MSDSIKLSPEHGVNPSMSICFWCGKEKNEIALMGKIDKKDSPAPKKIIMDYEPCDACKAIFDQGIQVIGVTKDKPVEGMFPIMTDDNGIPLYPTGAMFIGKPEWAERFLAANDSSDMIEHVLEKKAMLMPTELVEDFIKGMEEEVEEMDVTVPDADDTSEEENTDESN